MQKFGSMLDYHFDVIGLDFTLYATNFFTAPVQLFPSSSNYFAYRVH